MIYSVYIICTNIHCTLPYSGTTLRLSGDKLPSCTNEKNLSEDKKDNLLKRQNSILSKDDSFDIQVSQK